MIILIINYILDKERYLSWIFWRIGEVMELWDGKYTERKSTHTDLYFNAASHPDPVQKRVVCCILWSREHACFRMCKTCHWN